MTDITNLCRPIVGIENRTAQEAFDIMADRIRSALSRPIDPKAEVEPVAWMPIATAPKTGEEFIARTGPEWGAFSCSWDGEAFVHYDKDDGFIYYSPTEWLPMPAAGSSSPSIVAPVGVKPLLFEKQDVDGAVWASEVSATGWYIVRFDGCHWLAVKNQMVLARVGTRDAALEAAQDEHRNRILSALTPAEKAGVGDAATDVLAERRRQVEAEGWTAEHDDEHRNGEMARAAAVYALASAVETTGEAAEALSFWPWDWKWFKQADERRCLVKAGALILAEIERIDRAQDRPNAQAIVDGFMQYHERAAKNDHETRIRAALSAPASSDPVAFACKADIEALTEEGADISLSKVAMPRYGMKMALYANPATAFGLEVIADELTSALDGAFVTTTSGNGRPYLTAMFPELSQVRRLYDALAAFSSLRRALSTTKPAQGDGEAEADRRKHVGQGMAIAAAIIVRVWGDDTQATEILGAAGYKSVADLKRDEVDDYDIEPLAPLLARSALGQEKQGGGE